MAKIYSENSFLKRQRLSSRAPDEELAVIENGYSRSGLTSQTRVCWFSDPQRHLFCTSAADWQKLPAVIWTLVSPPMLSSGLSLFVGTSPRENCLRNPTRPRSQGPGLWPGKPPRWRKHYFMQPFWDLILIGQMILGNKEATWLFSSSP